MTLSSQRGGKVPKKKAKTDKVSELRIENWLNESLDRYESQCMRSVMMVVGGVYTKVSPR